MDIEKNLNSISKKLSNYDAKLIPVIKNRTVEEVKQVYDYGFREFGENRLEDYYLHSENFNDAIFHFIAPLQSRKIRSIFENTIFGSDCIFGIHIRPIGKFILSFEYSKYSKIKSGSIPDLFLSLSIFT